VFVNRHIQFSSRNISSDLHFCIRPNKVREQRIFFVNFWSNVCYKKQLFTFLSNLWATFWEFAGNVLRNLEQLVESRKEWIQNFARSVSYILPLSLGILCYISLWPTKKSTTSLIRWSLTCLHVCLNSQLLRSSNRVIFCIFTCRCLWLIGSLEVTRTYVESTGHAVIYPVHDVIYFRLGATVVG